MTQYAVSEEWEHNGYDDSDWYRVAFDPESGTLERVLTNTTRGCMNKLPLPELPEEHRAAFRAALLATWIQRMTAVTTQTILHPTLRHCPKGTAVRLSRAVRNRPRESVKVPCDKCAGSGHWTSTRNASVKGKCFRCDGTGSRSLNKAGKGAMVSHAEGTRAEVVRAFENRSLHGTWDRGATLVLRNASGVEFRAPIDAVRLDRELDPSVIESNARNRVEADSVYPLFATSPVSLM